MADSYFRRFAANLIRHGAIEIEEPDGERYRLGDASGAAPLVKFCDGKVTTALLRDPELAFGELFMDGRIVVLRGTIHDVLAIILSNLAQTRNLRWLEFLRRARHAVQRRFANNLRRAKDNVAHHYDIGNSLYALFLDSDWQYSCAYFETMTEDIDTAQLAKKPHLAAKMRLEPGLRVLDIGCGWGGLGLYLAGTCGAHVTGVTLSSEQLSLARQRCVAARLEGRIDFRLQDYRTITERYDRIVSVGMLEHVGATGYDEYFRKLAGLLTQDGVALIHSITSADADFRVGPWANKYIFPGSHVPSLSQLLPAIERAGLIVTDIETLRLHYARTLQLWRERFLANRDKARDLFDERFCRMWEFYLSVSQCMFEQQNCAVSQIQLARNMRALPVTRDYMMRREETVR